VKRSNRYIFLQWETIQLRKVHNIYDSVDFLDSGLIILKYLLYLTFFDFIFIKGRYSRRGYVEEEYKFR
jgi:hypothetical protein